ncbi:ATP-binding cassette domain-containing protein [Fervidibacillus halotolerans]|uniref:ATP-binding cassette domain-containing protein n=1 Tax=Fervidibacillus halotolerans TaxID=2980027 RepID=A0A9E8LZ73_9BACI|nr:ATP-binding cassette domain-containing protein [Fervidibacillus halotolerans]WAA12523.1 ATP-binding cassette domain-containing protein [Fervidibacillus halotolerans]
MLIRIRNLTKSFKKRVIFDNVNVDFHSNRINYLIGANGSGKTTLIKCLIQLELYKGDILFDSKSLNNIRDRIGVVFDHPPFYTKLSGFANLKLLSNQKKIDKELVTKLAEKLMIQDVLYNKVQFYSYGEKKKLSLLLALLSNPSYLILDEISNGLDYDSMILLKKLLPEWAKTKTIIVTGHHYEFYQSIYDHIFIINDKKIYETDHLDERIKRIYNGES